MEHRLKSRMLLIVSPPEERMRHLALASIVLLLAPMLQGQSPSKLDEPLNHELVITDPSVLRPCALGALAS